VYRKEVGSNVNGQGVATERGKRANIKTEIIVVWPETVGPDMDRSRGVAGKCLEGEL